MYRSGDRGKRRVDGSLEFLGRWDRQIKLRGQRIELGEIEAVLCAHESISQAAVTLVQHPQRGDVLVAYVERKRADSAPGPEDMRSFLAQQLPEAMLPNEWVDLEVMPRNQSGKIDRQALPLPSFTHTTRITTAPRDAIEVRLVAVWRELLGGAEVGVLDDFFVSGGHSLLAVRLLGRVRIEFTHEVPLAEFYREPTIAALARTIRSVARGAQTPLICLRPGDGSHAPLFLFHAAGGRAITYYAMARALPMERAIYAFEDQLETVRQTAESVSDMAARYLRSLRTLQPRGPYYLGGWSTGATVAFEAAR